LRNKGEKMNKVEKGSLNIISEQVEMIRRLFPEVVVENKIDFEKLRVILGDDVEQKIEMFQFLWNGKNNSIKIAQSPSFGTLVPSVETSSKWDRTENLYIEGDNLEVLKLLQKTYYGKIKVTYIDPPYNTGGDFVYKDDFKDSIENYKHQTNQTKRANPETNGRFHTDWLNMMFPRLMLAKNLMTADGVIFISIDDNEINNLRNICNEIFGDSNFIATIVWERAFSPVNTKKHFSPNHDYALCYAKNIEFTKNNGIRRSDESNERYNNPDNDPRGPWTSGDLSVGPAVQGNIYEIVTPSRRVVLPPSGYSWRLNKDRYSEYLNDNRIWFGIDGNNVPRIKRFLSEVKLGMTPMTVWRYTEVGHSQEAQQSLKSLFDGKAFFDYPKSVGLIKRMVDLYSDQESYILDFFSGSATTAHAVMQLNAEDGGHRKFIMVQLPELTEDTSEAFKMGYKNICEIGKERIRRAGIKLRKDLIEQKQNAGFLNERIVNPDAFDDGFKTYRLESTNIIPWDGAVKLQTNTLLSQYEVIKEGRTKADVLYEIMLKYGVFNKPVEVININGKPIYSVGLGFLIVCLEDNVTMEDVKEIGKLKPRNVIFLESGFVDDNQKINAVYTLEKLGIEEIKSI
jgi:adenine-specific DNA-methyltransferase